LFFFRFRILDSVFTLKFGIWNLELGIIIHYFLNIFINTVRIMLRMMDVARGK
jgi:hypothetical protein